MYVNCVCRLCTCTCTLIYMKIHVPSILAKGVKTISKQTQQTSSHNGLENSYNTATKGLENIKAATLA